MPFSWRISLRDITSLVRLNDTRLDAKDYVFALREKPGEKAWALSLFRGGAVINDKAGDVPVVLIGDTATRTVRAYASEGRQFTAAEGNPGIVQADGTDWRITEDCVPQPKYQFW